MVDMNGTIMSGDVAVAKVERGHIIPIEKGRMPLYLQTHDDLEGWLTSRAIDRHRPNSRLLKKVLRLTDTSDLSTALHAHGATLTDDFWVKAEHSSLSYPQVRFTQNYFDQLALAGSVDSFSREYPETALRSQTPELTNTGSYEKCWKLEDGKWVMYKNGTALEHFSELFTAKVGKSMGFDMAHYEDADGYVKTADFTQGLWNFEPASALVNDEEDYSYNYKKLLDLKPDLVKSYLDILYLDALVFNMDRHTNNYGFLRDRASGAILSMAPNYDNNIALISRGYLDDPERSSYRLITDFMDLLKAHKIPYHAPMLNENTVKAIADTLLIGKSIRRDYVVRMVMDRYQALDERLQEWNRHFEQRDEHPTMEPAQGCELE